MSWTIEEAYLVKQFQFNNFVEAVDFLYKIVPLAEARNHHPDVTIEGYNKMEIRLMTHDEGKVTEKDHELAVAIDALLVE